MANPAIPVISNFPQLTQWRNSLNSLSRGVMTPRIPWNFSVQSKQGGNYLQWQAVPGADGYIVSVSTTGDFSSGTTLVKLRGNTNTAYFDTTPTAQGATPAIRYYQVTATAGTTASPQSVMGLATGTISSTAIPPNNTTTVSTTSFDTTTNDSLQSNTRRGRYVLNVQ